MPLKNRTSSLHYNIFTGYFCIPGFLLAIPLAYYYNYIWYPNLLKSKGREPHPFGEGHCKLQKKNNSKTQFILNDLFLFFFRAKNTSATSILIFRQIYVVGYNLE